MAPSSKRSRAWMYKCDAVDRAHLGINLVPLEELNEDEAKEFWNMWHLTNATNIWEQTDGVQGIRASKGDQILAKDVFEQAKRFAMRAEAEGLWEVNDEAQQKERAASPDVSAFSSTRPVDDGSSSSSSSSSTAPPLPPIHPNLAAQLKTYLHLSAFAYLNTSAPTTMTDSDNHSQQHSELSVPASVTSTAKEVPPMSTAQTTTITATTTTTAMPGPGRSDPTAAAASSSSGPALQSKKSKKNQIKKKRRKEKNRLEKQRAADVRPVTASDEALDLASLPGTVPAFRVSSAGIRSSLETLLLVPAAEVRSEGDDLEDVVATRSTTPPPAPATNAGPDEVSAPSSPVTAAVTMTAATPPSPSSSVATEDRQLWNPWWNLHFHGKTFLQWQHEDGRREVTTFSALTRTNSESPCRFVPGCEQHAANTLCWCPECQTAVRWCCCAHYTSYCSIGPRPEGQGLIVASWPRRYTASGVAPVGAGVGITAAAATTANAVPGEPALASKETLNSEGQKSAVKSSSEEMAHLVPGWAASDYDPSSDESTSSFISTRQPRPVVRRLSWPITLCSAEERYPML